MAGPELLSYVRLYADEDGETHFEDVAVAAGERRAASGALVELSDLIPVAGLEFRLVVEDHPGDEPHNAPRRQFIITLAGDHEVTASDGEPARSVRGVSSLSRTPRGRDT